MTTPTELILQLPSLISSLFNIADSLEKSSIGSSAHNDAREMRSLVEKLAVRLMCFEECSSEIGSWKHIHHVTQSLLYQDLAICFKAAKDPIHNISPQLVSSSINAIKTSSETGGLLLSLSIEALKGKHLVTIPEGGPFSSDWQNGILEQVNELLPPLEKENLGTFRKKAGKVKNNLERLNCLADSNILDWVDKHRAMLANLNNDIDKIRQKYVK